MTTDNRVTERLTAHLSTQRLQTAESPSPLGWGRDSIPTMPPNGCFAAGTEVILSDGSTKAIEKIAIHRSADQPGDSIMTLGGRSSSVVDLVHGPESLPLVFLTVRAYDAAKQEQQLNVGLTDKHPVLVRYNYLVQANWLIVSDQVHTVFGPGIVTNVERRTIDGEVWNLVMTGPDFLQSGIYGDDALRYAYASTSLLGLSPRDHIIYANGIALATWPLQTQLAAALKCGTNLNQFS